MNFAFFHEFCVLAYCRRRVGSGRVWGKGFGDGGCLGRRGGFGVRGLGMGRGLGGGGEGGIFVFSINHENS